MEQHEILRAGRKSLGLHQYGLAHMIGITQSYVSHMEMGRRPITDELLARMPPAIREPLVRARIAELEKLLPALSDLLKIHEACQNQLSEVTGVHLAAEV